MTFSEANREFKILHTSHKKALNNIKIRMCHTSIL